MTKKKAVNSQQVILMANVGKTQIKETDTHWNISGIPVTVNGAVMNGVLYPETENAKGMPSLVNKPVALGHPSDKDGNFISAMEGEGLSEFFSGGVITKTYNKAGVNYADASIKKSVLLAQDKGEELNKRLTNKDQIGVSTGLTFDVNELAGTNKEGKPYESTAIKPNLRPFGCT